MHSLTRRGKDASMEGGPTMEGILWNKPSIVTDRGIKRETKIEDVKDGREQKKRGFFYCSSIVHEHENIENKGKRCAHGHCCLKFKTGEERFSLFFSVHETDNKHFR